MRGVQALPKNAVSTSVREEVRLLAATIHTAKGLKSDDLCDRHWGRIRALVPKLPPNCSSDSLSFGDLRKLGVIDSQDRCAGLCCRYRMFHHTLRRCVDLVGTVTQVVPTTTIIACISLLKQSGQLLLYG